MAPADSPFTDYYKILLISVDATDDEIKSAFRRLALIHHPDKQVKKPQNANDNAASFRKIREAYSILIDPNLRPAPFQDQTPLKPFPSRKKTNSGDWAKQFGEKYVKSKHNDCECPNDSDPETEWAEAKAWSRDFDKDQQDKSNSASSARETFSPEQFAEFPFPNLPSTGFPPRQYAGFAAFAAGDGGWDSFGVHKMSHKLAVKMQALEGIPEDCNVPPPQWEGGLGGCVCIFCPQRSFTYDCKCCPGCGALACAKCLTKISELADQ
ncbi:unnamed protein product [Periconia digitata]|uniref:J domain-containing protein n=1 Tax=Periconia digitata TaxID=1303443 RepID=A0A9W4XPN9_9PLEO|nr:unnamed protein product [Periconia digitata]